MRCRTRSIAPVTAPAVSRAAHTAAMAGGWGADLSQKITGGARTREKPLNSLVWGFSPLLCGLPVRPGGHRDERGHRVIIEAGQVAVVTGAAQGLGRALAAGLIDRGVSVVLADIAAERLHSTAEEFSARNARVLPVITDVSDA